MKEDYQFEIDFCCSILQHDARNLAVMEMLAGFYTKCGRIDEGLELDREIVILDPENAIGHFNLACSLCLKKSLPEALAALRTAMEKGYTDFDWILNDPDLEGLQQDPDFEKLLAEFQART